MILHMVMFCKTNAISRPIQPNSTYITPIHAGLSPHPRPTPPHSQEELWQATCNRSL